MADLEKAFDGILRKVDGFSLEQNVPVIVNSANNGLLLGGSGAGKIKYSTKYLTRGSPEEREFYLLCQSTGNIGANCKRWQEYEKSKDPSFRPSQVQLECLRIISERGGKSVELGSAHSTHAWNTDPQSLQEYIIHAVGMGYEWKSPQTKGSRILANADSITRAYANSFRLAQELGSRRIALPLMCTRPGYSEIGIDKTYEIFLEQLAKRKDSFDEVILCLDNAESQKFFGGRK